MAHRRRWVAIGLLGLVVAALAGAELIGNASRAAPDFEARSLAGQPIRLADLRGQHVVLLNFFSFF